MKLDRDINSNGKGKYALLNLRKLPGDLRTPQELADAILAHPEAVEWGCVGEQDEFFVIKLKDKYANSALHAYAQAAMADDPEYADAVSQMTDRAGLNSPFCKRPD